MEGVDEDRMLHDNNVSFSVSEPRPVGRCPEVLPQCLCNSTLQLVLASSPSTPVLS